MISQYRAAVAALFLLACRGGDRPPRVNTPSPEDSAVKPTWRREAELELRALNGVSESPGGRREQLEALLQAGGAARDTARVALRRDAARPALESVQPMLPGYGRVFVRFAAFEREAGMCVDPNGQICGLRVRCEGARSTLYSVKVTWSPVRRIGELDDANRRTEEDGYVDIPAGQTCELYMWEREFHYAWSCVNAIELPRLADGARLNLGTVVRDKCVVNSGYDDELLIKQLEDAWRARTPRMR
jgi:hypothetical protein